MEKITLLILGLIQLALHFVDCRWHVEQIEIRFVCVGVLKLVICIFCSFFLTIPPSVGYEQNPLSLYYCYDLEDSASSLKKCIAEVILTPASLSGAISVYDWL